MFKGCLLGGVPCIHRMSGGVIVGDSGLYCGPAFNVMCDVNCSSAIISHCLLILKVFSNMMYECCEHEVLHVYTGSEIE